MITIDPNLYEHNLLELFWTYKPVDEEDGKVYALLNRVCRAWINERKKEGKFETISSVSLNGEEHGLVVKYNLMEHPNLEVSTRFQDVMIRFGKGKDRLARMRKASDGYMELCRLTGTCLFFARSIEVRQAKVLYDETFMQTLRDVVINTGIHPGWLAKSLSQVKTKVDDGLENKYIKEILASYTAAVTKNDVLWVDAFWTMAFEIGAVAEAKAHYQRALNWEAYADQMEANRKPNVFNVNYHTVLQDSYKEIFKVKENYPEEYKRIRDKYNAAKKDFVESMSLYGVQTKYEIPKELVESIHKQMTELDLQSVYEAVICYLKVPFYAAWKKLVDDQVCKTLQKSDIIERFFPNSQHLDGEGNVTGVSNYEQDKVMQVHGCIRAVLLYHLLCLHERIDEHIIDYSEESFLKILLDCKPSFIEEDRVQLWAKAYRYYFDGDVVISSHLLMPQFEHALHNLLEEIVEDVTKLDAEVQKEPTLIKILGQLQPYCNPTLYDELEFFFVNGCDVNYRNQLLHGLIWSMDMIRYGHYLFYLANLLYFSGRKFLRMGEGV